MPAISISNRYDAATYARALVYQNEHGHVPDDISGDGKWVAMTKLNTSNDSDIYLWNAATKALYAELGDPVADEKMLYEVSPVFHAARIRKPLIVLQGANDPR